MDRPLDLKKATHPRAGGGFNTRDVKVGTPSSAAPTIQPSPKKATKRG